MSNKINLVFFVSSGFLSNYTLKKLIKLRKKINIILLVSDVAFKKELKKNKFRNFSWIINRKNNETKILKKIEKYKNENLYGFSLQYKWKICLCLGDAPFNCLKGSPSGRLCLAGRVLDGEPPYPGSA